MVMADINASISDAIQRLGREVYLSSVCTKHIEDRYFSSIYELSGEINGITRVYVLKIDTSNRSCENEYNTYKYLANIKIRSLTPVIFSDKYNYLVTEKEKLVDLPSVLKNITDNKSRSDYFYRFGKLLSQLESSTGEKTKFNKTEYDSYVVPRLMKTKCFSQRDKEIIKSKVENLSDLFNNKPITTSLVSDFNLGNIHLNECDEFVLLDMGDAYRDQCYTNIAGCYLTIKYGPLQQYIENKKNTKAYFSSFLSGYGLDEIKKAEFDLCQIKILVCMILFIESLENNKKSVIMKCLSQMSNEFLVAKYKKYLISLLEGNS